MSRNYDCKNAVLAYVAHNPGKTIYAVKEHFRTREDGTNYWNLEVRARIQELLNAGRLVKKEGRQPKCYGSTRIYLPFEARGPNARRCGNCLSFHRIPGDSREQGECRKEYALEDSGRGYPMGPEECCGFWTRRD